MALEAPDFIEPLGELEGDMFPGLELEEYVNGWIQAAKAKTSGMTFDTVEDEEAAQKAWVYHRAFNKLANRLNYNPAQYEVDDEGSEQWIKEQLADARRKAEGYETKFDHLTSTGDGATAPRSTTTQSKTNWI